MRKGEHVTSTLRLLRELGSGAMGSVWVAEHLGLSTQVAVKLMSPLYATEPEFVKRFKQEAQSAARIKSPHVVQVLDYGMTERGAPYIAMELLEGETLRSRLVRLGTLPLDDVVRVVLQAANGLSSAHALGIVHRDIKPENLFLIDVGGELFVKVLDFGIAKQPPGDTPGMTETGRMMGTAFYMSPEQMFSAKHVDLRTDVWALAVVAYEALTGRRPYQGQSFADQAYIVRTRGFEKPSAVRPGLPEAVDEWAMRALQRDPEARFGSMRALADALKEAVRTATLAATAPAAPPVVVPIEDRTTTPRVAPVTQPRDGTLVSGMAPWEGRASKRAVLELRIGAGFVQLVSGNIINAGTEAKVNSTDSYLFGGDGVDTAIRGAAGPELEQELVRSEDCPVGQAIITGAGRLPPPTRFIIHTVGPIYNAEREEECAALLRRAYLESLRVAEENNVYSIAFPAISTGSRGYPIEKAAPIALEAAATHLAGRARCVARIVFVLFSSSNLAAFTAALAKTTVS